MEMNQNQSQNREKRLEIATRIYELDGEVYRILGSGLGRVFNGKREDTIRNLADIMGSHSKGHYLRSEVALISNMARTIPDKRERARMEREYQAILKEIDELHSTFGSVDIMDETMASLNRSNLSRRFNEDNHLIICIGRTYGCAGTDIGFELSKRLGINYYDTEIFMEVLERLEAEKDSVKDHASFAHKQNLNQNLGIERSRNLKEWFREFNRYHGLNKSDAIFFNQSDLLCEMAKKEDFIVMGRCADVILTNNRIPHVSIFINAPFEMRVRHTMASDELSYKEAAKLLKKLDRQHGHYYNFYTGREWGNSVNYDLCINSASYGIEGAVLLIERLIQRTGKRPKKED